MKRILLFGLLGGLLATGSGCGLMQAIFYYRPCVTRGDCTTGYGYDGSTGEGCVDGCDSCRGPTPAGIGPPRRAWYRDPYDDPSWDPCGDPCWDPCGECCCGRPWHRGPLSCMFALFVRGSWWGPSCGERYWGDFYGDPPDCWDSCDCYGNYDGMGTHPAACRESRQFNRYSGENFDYGMSEGRARLISQTDRAVSESPTLATQPRRAPKQQ
ncbi:MAG: hypothetical protein JW959_03115 [Pirellulales bacterium]|nr:hypothetical protein [Pirellulales bacterium]